MRLLNLAAQCPLRKPLISSLCQMPVCVCTKTANLVRKIHPATSRWRGRLWESSSCVELCIWQILSTLEVYLPLKPNPPCQISLWEETGVPGENLRLSAERWLYSFHMRTGFESRNLRGERRVVWPLHHRLGRLIWPGLNFSVIWHFNLT